jgi:hypothetical protein
MRCENLECCCAECPNLIAWEKYLKIRLKEVAEGSFCYEVCEGKQIALTGREMEFIDDLVVRDMQNGAGSGSWKFILRSRLENLKLCNGEFPSDVVFEFFQYELLYILKLME